MSNICCIISASDSTLYILYSMVFTLYSLSLYIYIYIYIYTICTILRQWQRYQHTTCWFSYVHVFIVVSVYLCCLLFIVYYCVLLIAVCCLLLFAVLLLIIIAYWCLLFMSLCLRCQYATMRTPSWHSATAPLFEWAKQIVGAYWFLNMIKLTVTYYWVIIDLLVIIMTKRTPSRNQLHASCNPGAYLRPNLYCMYVCIYIYI